MEAGVCIPADVVVELPVLLELLRPQPVVLSQLPRAVEHELPDPLRRALLAAGDLHERLAEMVQLVCEVVLDGRRLAEPVARVGGVVRPARHRRDAQGAGCRRRLPPVSRTRDGPVPTCEGPVKHEDAEAAAVIGVIQRLAFEDLAGPLVGEAELRGHARVLDVHTLPAEVRVAAGDTSGTYDVRLHEHLGELLLEALRARHQQQGLLVRVRGEAVEVLEALTQHFHERVLQELFVPRRHRGSPRRANGAPRRCSARTQHSDCHADCLCKMS
mmetsp:Transcript_109194/g.308893  ORF Transcript_109194/g.308893 Transcript_109194/m.308893 type:complete len:272 (-) Transcript_109194:1-816(-)